MTESDWLRACEITSNEAKREGLIGLLDTLILLKDRLVNDPLPAWRTSIYRLYDNIRRWVATVGQGSVSGSEASIIFFPTEPTHVNQMVPVARRLNDWGIPNRFVTPRMRLVTSLKHLRLPVRLVFGLVSRGGREIVMNPHKARKALFEMGYEQSLPFLDRYFLDIERLSHSLWHLLEKLRPSYVLIGNDLTWECRLFARLCHLKGIRTGMIQHGLLGREVYNRFHIVDDFFVYGQMSKEILEADGLTGVNIHVTGAPYLDAKDMSSFRPHNPAISSAMGLKGSFILVALSGVGHRTSVSNYRLILSWIDRLIRDHSELDFVIKLHRKEKLESYFLFSASQRRRIVDRKAGTKLPRDIFEWLKGCSCLITGTSTVAYEAMLLGIPVISIDPLKEFRGVDFIDQKMAMVVSTYEELEFNLTKLNGRQMNYEPFIGKVFDRVNGQASERIAVVCAKISTDLYGLSRKIGD